jgi:hypothetical protein
MGFEVSIKLVPMRTATQIRAHADDTEVPRRGSGRRIKAAERPEPGTETELALAMTDALEHILEDERRTA